MTWLGEVAHVLRKDLRQSRRLLLLYLAIIAVATAHALWLPVLDHAVFGSSMLFVGLVGLFLVASVIQSDSPTRSDAFWATHPFRRPAMLGAKVAFALAVVGVATVGQAIGLRSYDVTGGALVRELLGPSAMFGAALLCVMLLAALTRNLSSFVVAAIAIPLGAIIAYSAFDEEISRIRIAPAVLQVAVLVAVAALVSWLYLKRDDRRRMRWAGLALLTLTCLAMCAPESGTPPVEHPLSTAPPITVALEPFGPGRPSPSGVPQLSLNLTGVEDGVDGEVLVHRLTLRARDGAEVRASLENGGTRMASGSIVSSSVSGSELVAVGVIEDGADPVLDRVPFGGRLWGPAPPRIPGVRWLGERSSREVRDLLTPRLNPAQQRTAAPGIVSAELAATLRVWDSGVDGRMPLVEGAELTEDGHRIRVVQWTPADGAPVLVIRIGTIDRLRERRPMTMMGEAAGLALVNERRGEAVMLERHGSRGTMDGLVLPGAPFVSATTEYGLRRGDPSADAPTVDAAWLREARLYMIGSRYRGVYPLRMRANLAAPAEGGPRPEPTRERPTNPGARRR